MNYDDWKTMTPDLDYTCSICDGPAIDYVLINEAIICTDCLELRIEETD